MRRKRGKHRQQESKKTDVVSIPDISGDNPKAKGKPTGQVGTTNDPAAFLDGAGPL